MTDENILVLLIFIPVVAVPLAFLLIWKLKDKKLWFFITLLLLSTNYTYHLTRFFINNESGWLMPRKGLSFMANMDMVEVFGRGVTLIILFTVFVIIWFFVKRKRSDI